MRNRLVWATGFFTSICALAATADPVHFPDTALEVEIRNALGFHEGPIQRDHLARLTKISLYQTSVRDLTGLEHCTNITVLYALSNKIENIQSLAAMPQLKQVWLNNNTITDLSPLLKLPYLRDLSIAGNPIDDLTPIAEMVTLRRLNIGGVAIRDPGFLSALVHLEDLYIARTGLKNLDFAAEMPKLERLLASDNQIESLEPLRGLEHLKQIELKNNRIGDLSPLAGLSNVWWLELTGNHLGTLEGLPAFRDDAKVLLYDNLISDLGPLARACARGRNIIIELGLNQLDQDAFCTHIPELEKRRNRVVYRRKSPDDRSIPFPDHDLLCEAAQREDGSLILAAVNRGATDEELAEAFGLPAGGAREIPAAAIQFADANLERVIREQIDKPAGAMLPEDVASIRRLQATGKDIFDLTGLEHLKGVEMMALQSNHIRDLTPLAALPQLQTLFISHNQITDLSPLAALKNLKQLAVDFNAIERIEPIVHLPALRELHLTGNPIASLDSLRELRALNDLYIRGIGATSLEFLAGLTSMRKLDAADNQITSLVHLRGLRGLVEINLAGNRVTSLEPIAQHEKLYRLDLRNNRLTSLEGMPGFWREATILLHGNEISDIAPILDATGQGDPVCIELGRNHLGPEAFCRDIPELFARGHDVVYAYNLPDSVRFPDAALVCGAMEREDAETILASVNGGASDSQLRVRLARQDTPPRMDLAATAGTPDQLDSPSATLAVSLAETQFNISVESSGLDLKSLLGVIAVLGALAMLVIALKIPRVSR
ncbi:MAG: leucine-rich repeat domain-containing protein [Candidatus Hydrogenedentes bacterium]|nr:leucine-rich repeat domain-containing protein [Candidatus Hydrogenedentota bacterium]